LPKGGGEKKLRRGDRNKRGQKKRGGKLDLTNEKIIAEEVGGGKGNFWSRL